MQLVDQEIEVWGLSPYKYEDVMEWIARAGRVCYRSEAKTDAAAFINKRLQPDPPHSSILEHCALCFVEGDVPDELPPQFFHPVKIRGKYGYVANVRAWYELTGMKTIEDIYSLAVEDNGCELIPTEELPRDLQRVTVQLTTDRAVMAEISRHRNDTAFSIQSQRYVDLQKEIVYIKPSWFYKDNVSEELKEEFIKECACNEQMYKHLRAEKLAPQDARVVLNNQCQTIIVMSAYLSQWDWIFKLRTSKAAYPQMVNLMSMVKDKFAELGYV